jgi:hypothetical protein
LGDRRLAHRAFEVGGAQGISASGPPSAARSTIRLLRGKSISSWTCMAVKPRTPLPSMMTSKRTRKPAEISTAPRPMRRKRRSAA